MLSELANRIRSARKGAHLGQKELAEKMNVSVGTVSQWERGVSMPSVSEIINMARHLGVNQNWLEGRCSPMDEGAVIISPRSGALQIQGNAPTLSTGTNVVHGETAPNGMVRIPYISTAWGLLDQLAAERGLSLTEDEHSRVLVMASMAGIREDREPTMRDVLNAVAEVLGGGQ